MKKLIIVYTHTRKRKHKITNLLNMLSSVNHINRNPTKSRYYKQEKTGILYQAQPINSLPLFTQGHKQERVANSYETLIFILHFAYYKVRVQPFLITAYDITYATNAFKSNLI